MSLFIQFDHTVSLGKMINEEKIKDVSVLYNPDKVLTDINRTNRDLHISIAKKPLEYWKKLVAQNDSSVDISSKEHLTLLFEKILAKKSLKLEQEKRQQYVHFLSNFLNQNLYHNEAFYLSKHKFLSTKINLSIDIALHKEAIYIQTKFSLPVLIPRSTNGELSDIEEKLSNVSRFTKKDFKSTATYKIVLTQTQSNEPNPIKDNSNPIKIEVSLLEFKVTCRKKYAEKFNPHIEEKLNSPVTENSRLPYFLCFLLDKIRFLSKFIKYIFEKDTNIHSSSIQHKEAKFTLEPLSFSPTANKVTKYSEEKPEADNLVSSEAEKSDNTNPLPLKEETICQKKDIHKEEQYSLNTDPTEKKVKLDTDTKIDEKLTTHSKS